MTSPDPETLLYRVFALRFPTEDACLDHLLKLRFGNPGYCPRCARKGKFHRLRAQQAYICQWCAFHIHPKAGTPFARTRTPLQDWFYVMFLFCVGHKKMTAREVQRQLGLTYKTAWRITDEIKKQLARE
ncbi:MAG: IS1595 family transposase [Micropepsaceae bacterium]